MPRTAQEIIEQAEALGTRFESHEPREENIRDAATLRKVRKAFQSRAAAELELAKAVAAARADGHSWSAIGAMLGTSGEAARQRYGMPATKR